MEEGNKKSQLFVFIRFVGSQFWNMFDPSRIFVYFVNVFVSVYSYVHFGIAFRRPPAIFLEDFDVMLKSFLGSSCDFSCRCCETVKLQSLTSKTLVFEPVGPPL